MQGVYCASCLQWVYVWKWLINLIQTYGHVNFVSLSNSACQIYHSKVFLSQGLGTGAGPLLLLSLEILRLTMDLQRMNVGPKLLL